MKVDLERFSATPLITEPFPYLLVPQFLKPEAFDAVLADYPIISRAGSFPLSECKYGPAFEALVKDFQCNQMRQAFQEKFSVDLAGKPLTITARGRCDHRDGKIHTDSKTKILTLLIYMNSAWEQSGGQLRLLRNGNDLDDYIMEVPPIAGTLLAFKRSDNSWHGHKSFEGERRVLQLNWVTSEEVAQREANRHRFSAWIKKLNPLHR